MRRYLAGILLCILTLQGCAQVLHSLEATPQRLEDVWEDPIRREHVIWQSLHLASTSAVTIGCTLVVPPPASLVVCPLVGLGYNYVTYEYLLEPWSKARVEEGKPSRVGPYWERGPQDGEWFVRE